MLRAGCLGSDTVHISRDCNTPKATRTERIQQQAHALQDRSSASFVQTTYHSTTIIVLVVIVITSLHTHTQTRSSTLLQILARTTRLSMMLMSAPIQARQQPRTLRISLPKCCIRPRNSLKAQRILGHTVRNALRVQQIRVFGKVVDIVARLVVARVERRARLAAKHNGFLFRLEDFGAGE
jgi:hypothetical protein